MGIQTNRTSYVREIMKNAGTAAVITLISSAATALAIEKEWMDFSKTGYAAMAILLASGYLCGRAGKGRRLPLAAATTAAYMTILLITNLLFFGGQFQKIGITVLILTLGTALAMIQPGGKQKAKVRYKIPGR